LPSFSEEELKLFQSIDTFAQRLVDKEYEISSGARILTFPEIHHGTGVYLESRETVSEGLADALHYYQIASDPKTRIAAAHDADLWIKRAFTSNNIGITENFFLRVQRYKSQVDSYKKQIAVLQEDNTKLSADNLILQGKYEECQRNLHIRDIGQNPH